MSTTRRRIAAAGSLLLAAAAGWMIGARPRYEYVPARWMVMQTMMRIDRRTGESWLMTGTVHDLEWSPVQDNSSVR